MSQKEAGWDVHLRPAVAGDAAAMGDVLAPILARWGSPRPSDPAHVLARYIADPDRIACTVVEGKGRILGFQSLKEARSGNPYGLRDGWGIIGTYVDRAAAGRGLGRRLFEVSLAAATGRVFAIDATIAAQNTEGLAYYQALGFSPYQCRGTALCQRYDLA